MADDQPTLFDPETAEPGADCGFVLWFRAGGERMPWKMVGRYATCTGAVAAIGAGRRRNGKWLVLPAGQRP